MIEKLGHGKRMGVMRREWMKEGTGGKREKRKKDATEVEHVRRKGDKVVVEESLFVGPTAEEEDMEDLLRDDAGDDDELDALLMEEPILRTEHVAPVEDVSQPELEAVGEGLEDQYAEEMRVMAEMEDW